MTRTRLRTARTRDDDSWAVHEKQIIWSLFIIIINNKTLLYYAPFSAHDSIFPVNKSQPIVIIEAGSCYVDIVIYTWPNETIPFEFFFHSPCSGKNEYMDKSQNNPYK
jgi:hypothetical protein